MQKPPRLRELRERRLLSRNELSERSGVGYETITRLENGEGGTWPRTVRKLADALGVGYEELYEEPAAPLAEPLRKRPSEPDAGDSSFGDSRTLAGRRLLSSLDPFATHVKARTEYWKKLAESGQVNLYALEYATEELGFTALSFKVLVDAAIAEQWSGAELGLLRRVYENVAGPYHLAWKTLIEAYVEVFTRSFDDPTVVSLRQRGGEAMSALKEAEEAVRTAA